MLPGSHRYGGGPFRGKITQQKIKKKKRRSDQISCPARSKRKSVEIEGGGGEGKKLSSKEVKQPWKRKSSRGHGSRVFTEWIEGTRSSFSRARVTRLNPADTDCVYTRLSFLAINRN